MLAESRADGFHGRSDWRWATRWRLRCYERRGFKEEDFAALHPGGRLGQKLRRIESLMHAGDVLPRVAAETKMPDVIYEMSRKGLGLAAVTEAAGKLLGIITDGDLRRTMQTRKQGVLELVALGLHDEESGDAAEDGVGCARAAADGRKERSRR